MDATLESKALSVRVMMIYVPPNGKIPEILLVREKPEKSYGAEYIWTAPGGGHEPIKDNGIIETTAVREFFEETGIELDPESLDDKCSCVFRGGSLKPRFDTHEVYAFLVVTKHKSTPSPKDSDIADARWFRLSELPSEAFLVDGAPLASSIWSQLRKLFEDKSCQQLLTAAGIGEKRINGLLKAWEKRNKRPSIPA